MKNRYRVTCCRKNADVVKFNCLGHMVSVRFCVRIDSLRLSPCDLSNQTDLDLRSISFLRLAWIPRNALSAGKSKACQSSQKKNSNGMVFRLGVEPVKRRITTPIMFRIKRSTAEEKTQGLIGWMLTESQRRNMKECTLNKVGVVQSAEATKMFYTLTTIINLERFVPCFARSATLALGTSTIAHLCYAAPLLTLWILFFSGNPKNSKTDRSLSVSMAFWRSAMRSLGVSENRAGIFENPCGFRSFPAFRSREEHGIFGKNGKRVLK